MSTKKEDPILSLRSRFSHSAPNHLKKITIITQDFTRYKNKESPKIILII